MIYEILFMKIELEIYTNFLCKIFLKYKYMNIDYKHRKKGRVIPLITLIRISILEEIW